MGTDENGYITNHEMLMEVAALKTSENYKLENLLMLDCLVSTFV